MVEEKWLDIKGYEGLYQVSNLGRVRSLDRKAVGKNGIIYTYKGKILDGSYNTDGYKQVKLCRDGKQTTVRVHRLVMTIFCPCDDMDNLEVDHINTIRDDNRLENLKWTSHSENCNNDLTRKKYSVSNGGENNPYYGKKHSKEIREKMSRNSTTKRAVRCIETGEIFDSIIKASEYINLDPANIGRCCNGKRKTAGGYHWEFV